MSQQLLSLCTLLSVRGIIFNHALPRSFPRFLSLFYFFFFFFGVKICPHAMQTPQTQCCLLQINKGEARRVSDTSSSEQASVIPASKSWAAFGRTVYFCLLVRYFDFIYLFIHLFVCIFMNVCKCGIKQVQLLPSSQILVFFRAESI